MLLLKNIFNVKYLENGDSYDDGVNGSRIGYHPWAIDWHHALWRWMPLNRPNSRSRDFGIKYLEYGARYDIGHNGGHIGNHQWAFDWDYDHWPWMTLNRPSSRSLQLQSNVSITAYWMQQHWADTRSIERISCLLVCWHFWPVVCLSVWIWETLRSMCVMAVECDSV